MMARLYYDEGGIQIWHGDCRDVLPTLAVGSVDLVLTDPPYGVRWESGFRQVGFGPIQGDDGTLPVLDILGLALRSLKRGRHVYAFGLDTFGDLPVGGRTELVWDKGIHGGGDLSLPWAPAHERILFGVYQSSKANREDGAGRLAARLRRGSVLRGQRAHGSGVTRHPTEKPISILREMIEASSLFGDVVLDPFVGSGSTLVAAQLEARCAIGIEIEERYCEVAAKRLSQIVLPLAGVS